MAVIQVRRNHSKTSDEMKVTIEEMAAKLQQKLQVRTEWLSASVMSFQRKGAKGEIVFDELSVELTLRLGMMFRALKGPIESEINTAFDKFLD